MNADALETLEALGDALVRLDSTVREALERIDATARALDRRLRDVEVALELELPALDGDPRSAR